MSITTVGICFTIFFELFNVDIDPCPTRRRPAPFQHNTRFVQPTLMCLITDPTDTRHTVLSWNIHFPQRRFERARRSSSSIRRCCWGTTFHVVLVVPAVFHLHHKTFQIIVTTIIEHSIIIRLDVMPCHDLLSHPCQMLLKLICTILSRCEHMTVRLVNVVLPNLDDSAVAVRVRITTVNVHFVCCSLVVISLNSGSMDFARRTNNTTRLRRIYLNVTIKVHGRR
mmetsp:Transcript_48980/g.118612  ORF Transcript_48980/g.118612 Transcript_48980/m.118612 type:complete len:225 (+) Transcript_48980:1258-1932(+)